MITFYNDKLAPPELCQLLYQTIPEEHHVPVIFVARNEDLDALSPVMPDPGGRCLGAAHAVGDGLAPGDMRHDFIVICLHMIWSCRGSIGSTEFCLWSKLLGVAYHEFGHVATHKPLWSMVAEGHWWEDWVEVLAETWGQAHVQLVADYDDRLAQPKTIKGYLGARLSQYKNGDWLCYGWGSARARRVKDWRCYKTNTQFSTGDAIKKLDLTRFRGDPYDLLRYLSRDVGVEYMDSAGRMHKLYTYGDLRILKKRLPIGLIGYRPTERISDAQLPLPL